MRLARWAALAGYLAIAAVLAYAIAVRLAFRWLGNPDVDDLTQPLPVLPPTEAELAVSRETRGPP